MFRWKTSRMKNGHAHVHSRRSLVASFYRKALHEARTTMVTEDLFALSQQDAPTLAKWWCSLNSWSWPDELAKPADPDVRLDSRRSRIMRWIEEAIGMRECLREWNRDTMQAEEFNDFWLGTFEGVETARRRFLAWLRDEEAHPIRASSAIQQRDFRDRLREVLRDRTR